MASIHTGKWTSLVVVCRIGGNRARRTSLHSGWPIHCRRRWLHQWKDEREIWLRWHPLPWSADEQLEYEERFSRRLQEWLDAGMGACHLRRCDVRAKVERCLLYFDGKRYDIDAFVFMPNHVHALIAPRLGCELSILKGIKGVSANECNKLLGRKSTFWMDESYDHIVRDANELVAFRNYISANPGKAGLKPDEYSLEIRNVLEIRGRQDCLPHDDSSKCKAKAEMKCAEIFKRARIRIHPIVETYRADG